MVAYPTSFTQYQVYGERCSGTNYVIRLMERNISSARYTEEFGHKHWYVQRREQLHPQCLVVVVARNPYDWLRSLYRKPWHVDPTLASLPFSGFIRAQWRGGLSDATGVWTELERERHPGSGQPFSNVLELRRVKLQHWTSLEQIPRISVLRVAYEEVYSNPRAYLTSLQKRYGLLCNKNYVPVTTYKGEITSEYVPRLYTPMTSEDIAHIDRSLHRPTERGWYSDGMLDELAQASLEQTGVMKGIPSCA